jgi:hypothetical protein
MIEPREKLLLSQLFLKFKDQTITSHELETLEAMLRQPEHVVQLTQITEVYIQLHRSVSELLSKPDDYLLNEALWNQLAEHENTAPVSEIPQGKPQRELIQKVVYPPREKRKISKFTIFMLLNTAALIFFLLFLRFADTTSGIEVATLTDSLHATWGNADGEMVNGASIATSDKSLMLLEGYAQLLFTNQTKITVEGPAEFQVLAEDQIKLLKGCLYVMVPRKAIGFTVKTLSSQIVDLGTEFGVQADLQGDTSLHVIKGRTVLIAGNPSDKVSVEVNEGTAKRVSTVTQAVSDISCNTQLFVRDINSSGSVVWRGQMQIDLADIVGGGNGFGTGRANVGINPASGQLVSSLLMSARMETTGRYSQVPENAYIDGVFVPYGGGNPQVVTSRGDIFKECPQTDGRYWMEITNKPITGFEGDPKSVHPARLNGIEYGTASHPAIMMHANTGITFDLEAIRSMLPSTRILRFTSTCGLSETLYSTTLEKDASADLWVLVDGQPREQVQVDFEDKSSAFVTVSIHDTDRFLTLVSSSDWNAGDWTLYGDPVLELELTDQQ